MPFLFYAMGWLSIVGGIAHGGYLFFNATRALTTTDAWMAFVLHQSLTVLTPPLLAILAGVLVLAVAGLLSRLDEIAYNTRHPDMR